MNLTEVTNLTALAVRASRIRGFVPFGLDETNLVRGVLNGTIILDPVELDREVETYIATVRCHERCKPTVRKMGYAIHKQFEIDPNLCEVCATPMVCKNPDGTHTYEPVPLGTPGVLTSLRHTTSKCSECGHVHIVDNRLVGR